MTSPRLPLVKAQRSFLSGIRLSWELTSGSHVTTTKKKTREKSGHAQNILLDRASSGHVTASLPVKKPH